MCAYVCMYLCGSTENRQYEALVVDLSARTHTCKHTYECVHTSTHTHTHTHSHIHTHTHTHIHTITVARKHTGTHRDMYRNTHRDTIKRHTHKHTCLCQHPLSRVQERVRVFVHRCAMTTEMPATMCPCVQSAR